MRTFWQSLKPTTNGAVSFRLAGLPKLMGHLLLYMEKGPPDGSEALMPGVWVLCTWEVALI